MSGGVRPNWRQHGISKIARNPQVTKRPEMIISPPSLLSRAEYLPANTLRGSGREPVCSMVNSTTEPENTVPFASTYFTPLYVDDNSRQGLPPSAVAQACISKLTTPHTSLACPRTGPPEHEFWGLVTSSPSADASATIVPMPYSAMQVVQDAAP